MLEKVCREISLRLQSNNSFFNLKCITKCPWYSLVLQFSFVYWSFVVRVVCTIVRRRWIASNFIQTSPKTNALVHREWRHCCTNNNLRLQTILIKYVTCTVQYFRHLFLIPNVDNKIFALRCQETHNVTTILKFLISCIITGGQGVAPASAFFNNMLAVLLLFG